MTTRRIMLLTIDYAPQTGGVPHLLSSIVDGTPDIEWRVLTIAPGPASDAVVRCASLRELVVEALRHRQWLRDEPSHIVSGHVYLGPLAHLVGLLSRTRVSSLTYGRELAPNRLHQRLALRSLRLDHRAVTISRNSELLLHRLGVHPTRTSWVGTELTPTFPVPPLHEPRFQPAMAGRSPASERADDLHLVAVTRLAEGYKNLEVTLRAVAVLADAGVVSRYTIIGDGPRRSALEARTASLGLDEVVHFAGRLDDDELATTLAAADLGLFPSRYARAEGGFEGFGIVIQELAAAGIPVIAGDAAGARDAVRDEWATLVDPDDVRAWVTAISSHHENPGEQAARRRAAARFGRTLDSAQTAGRYVEELLGTTQGVR